MPDNILTFFVVKSRGLLNQILKIYVMVEHDQRDPYIRIKTKSAANLQWSKGFQSITDIQKV
jgi:hypothetical protein